MNCVCCSVLQCVAVCCSVLQCVAVCCSVLQCWYILDARTAYTTSHTHQFSRDSWTAHTTSWLINTTSWLINTTSWLIESWRCTSNTNSWYHELVQPVPEKMRLETVVGMQTKILDGQKSWLVRALCPVPERAIPLQLETVAGMQTGILTDQSTLKKIITTLCSKCSFEKKPKGFTIQDSGLHSDDHLESRLMKWYVVMCSLCGIGLHRTTYYCIPLHITTYNYISLHVTAYNYI